ncbi:MAG: UDP-N-acetylglucosamine 1-carboxyvinyltransferase [Patescibacteria group bacterium]
MAANDQIRMVIRGGKPLNGDIQVGGMKNAATPIIAATLLIRDVCVLTNVPRLSDVERMLDILRSLGADLAWTGPNTLSIDTSKADIGSLDRQAVKAMRSSILLMGALLARFNEATIPQPGGCIIGNRPIDDHLRVLSGLNANIKSNDDGTLTLTTNGLTGSKQILPVFSVTATENALMAAVTATGTTIIRLAAAEPHVTDLGEFLVSAGAKISGLGTHTIVVEGVKALHSTTHRIIPDQIEAGTLAVLGALTKGTLNIRGVELDHLDMILLQLQRAGVNFEVKGDTLIMPSAGMLKSFKLQTLPYPGFPTDLQAPFGVLATQCAGTSLIHDPMYEGRLGYINELAKMGANATICDPHRVVVTGPTPLYGNEIHGLDLRAGATLVIAGLLASGETILHNAAVIDRGYERLDQRLRALGADIQRME